MKKIIPLFISVILFSSCHPGKERIVYDFIKAENNLQLENISQQLSDSFYYYGLDTLNKDEYLSMLDYHLKYSECHATILNYQDLDSVVKTEEQVLNIVGKQLGITPFFQKMTYKISGDKLISITVDSTNTEEYIKSFNEKWAPFALYIKEQYGITEGDEIGANIKKYLSEYTALPNSEKKQYKTYAYLLGTYVSKDCTFYKKLIFKGKRTVTIIDAIFGFPFSTSYEIDEDIVKVMTDRGELLFDIKDSQTLIGEGFASGTFIKEN